jgi:hypothetical protein
MPVVNPLIGLETLQFQAGIQAWYTDQTRINFDDFYNGNASLLWTLTGSGSGTTAQISDVADHPGLIEQNTGALATAAQMMGLTGPTPLFVSTSGIMEYRIMLNIVNLSDATDRYIFQTGISDAAITGDVNNGVYFEYSDNINAGNWTLCAANGGVRTKVDSGVLVTAGTYYEISLQLNPAAPLATFYREGVALGSVATNLPIAQNTNVRPLHMKKQAGTNSRAIRADYVFFGYSFRPGR